MTATTTRAAETWAHILAEVDPMPVSIAADYARDDGSEPAEACAAVEAVAQQHLDAHPDDHRARRLLGEWLQWHEDARGEGYRALAACGRVPRCVAKSFLWYHLEVERRQVELRNLKYPEDAIDPSSDLPSRWREGVTAEYMTRRDAEDAAALAFARLPDERRAALLKGEM